MTMTTFVQRFWPVLIWLAIVAIAARILVGTTLPESTGIAIYAGILILSAVILAAVKALVDRRAR